MFTKATMFVVLCSALAFGCSASQRLDSAEETREIIDNLVRSGFPADDIMVVDGAVYVGRDAHVTLEASREMLESSDGSAEQYRTTNVVSPSVRKICINPTSSFSSNSSLLQGLYRTVCNYNAIPLSFDFAVGPTFGCGANISITTQSGTGSSSGFPSGGSPYPGPVYIGTGLQAYSIDVIEHVITHELGHATGFRHADYYNRSISCGSGGNEGGLGVGAILIPGTPGMATVGGSIMNSCFNSTVTGEFTSSDVTGLLHMYNFAGCGNGICDNGETQDTCWPDCGCDVCACSE